ncbi:MAG: hypothetical protein AB7L41_04525 [Flavobacteriaceae bacterium]
MAALLTFLDRTRALPLKDVIAGSGVASPWAIAARDARPVPLVHWFPLCAWLGCDPGDGWPGGRRSMGAFDGGRFSAALEKALGRAGGVRAFAAASGVSAPTVSRAAAGRPVSFALFLPLCSALGMQAGDFLLRTGPIKGRTPWKGRAGDRPKITGKSSRIDSRQPKAVSVPVSRETEGFSAPSVNRRAAPAVVQESGPAGSGKALPVIRGPIGVRSSASRET